MADSSRQSLDGFFDKTALVTDLLPAVREIVDLLQQPSADE